MTRFLSASYPFYTDLEWSSHLDRLRRTIYCFPPEVTRADHNKEQAVCATNVQDYDDGRAKYSVRFASPQARTRSSRTPHPSRKVHATANDPTSKDRANGRRSRGQRRANVALPQVNDVFRDILTIRHSGDIPNIPLPDCSRTTHELQASLHAPQLIRSPSGFSNALFYRLSSSAFSDFNKEDQQPEGRVSRPDTRDNASYQRRRRSGSFGRALKAFNDSVESICERISGEFQSSLNPAHSDWEELVSGCPPLPAAEMDSPPIEFHTNIPGEQYFKFSTLSPHPIVYNGKRYPTCFHLLQSFKVCRIITVYISATMTHRFLLCQFQPHRPDLAERVRKAGDDPFEALARAHQFSDYVRKDWLGTLQKRRVCSPLIPST